MPPYVCSCGLKCWDPHTPPVYCTQRPRCGPFVDEGTLPEELAPDSPHPPPDLPPPPGGSVAVQSASNTITIVPIAHQPMPVGLLSMPVEILHLILTNIGPGLVPVLGALHRTSNRTHHLTQLALGADMHLATVPIFTNMLFRFQTQWQPHAAEITQQLAVGLTGNLETLKALVKKLTLLRKECLFLITQLEGLLSGIENVCRLIDGADTVRRATITANLVALRDRVRALRDQIAAQATALGLRLQAAKKAESQKRSLMRL